MVVIFNLKHRQLFTCNIFQNNYRKMEPKQTDVHLRAMLNSPARFTPAVPTPDWSAGPAVPPSPQTPGKSNMIVATPGSAAGEPHTNITIQNCVTTVDLNTKLDLALINARTRNSEYNPARFHGLIMRLRDPRTTALIFQTGKIVCTGAKSEQDALLASKKFARIIQKLGFDIKFENFKIQNLVATCDLRFPIKLESLSLLHGQFCSYEPELFPGIIYRMIKPHLCLLIFVNGKIVFTGSKSREDSEPIEGADNHFRAINLNDVIDFFLHVYDQTVFQYRLNFVHEFQGNNPIQEPKG